jgi:cytochrome c553
MIYDATNYMRNYAILFAAVTTVFGFRVTTGATIAAAATNPIQVGAQLVSAGNKQGAVACARCHGYDGASDGSGAFPILAGQSVYYLTAQLRNFASGDRQNALMSSIAKSLTDDEMRSVAQYYSAVRPTLPVKRQGEPDVVARGQYIATEGNLSNRVQACISCHGPNGTGEQPAIPYLSGQYKHYIELQLLTFKKGYRKDAQMGSVGHHLSDEEATAVASYFDQLPLPNTQ